MSSQRQIREQSILTKYDQCYAEDKHRTVGIKEELNPARETREGFLEEATPEPELKESQVRVGCGIPGGRNT